MERKFKGLRKRLDQLGYRQPLGVESFPLVERLIADLLQTTESLKICKMQVTKNKEQKGLWQQHVQPYRHDNARLTQENLELHQKLMKVKETSESRNKDLKTALRKLEHENTDLKFLNTQYMQKLLAKEKESLSKSERIVHLQEKSAQAIIHTPGGRKTQVALRRQRMDLDNTLPDNSALSSRQPAPDPCIVDLVKMSDNSIASLRRDLEQRQKENTKLLGSIEDLTKQVQRREKEIERLSCELRGGRPPEALAMEGRIEGDQRMVAHLNIQVDFLQKANSELEKQLNEEMSNTVKLKERVSDLSSKNCHICNELQEIGELVKQMERERRESEVMLREEACQWKTKLEDQQCKHEELLKDNRQLALLLSECQADSEVAVNVLDQLTRENKSIKKHYHQSELKNKSVLTDDIHKVRRERDELQEAMKEVEQQLVQIQTQAKCLAQDRDNFKLLYQQALTNITPVDNVTSEVKHFQVECDNLRERLVQETARAEQLQRVNHDLKEELKTTQSSAHTEAISLKSSLQNTQGLLEAGERKTSEQQMKQVDSSHDEVVRLKRLVAELQERVKQSVEKEREVAQSLKRLDEDYDNLRVECDSKDENIAHLHHERDRLLQECAQLKMEVQKSFQSESATTIHLQTKSSELFNLRQQLSLEQEDSNHHKTIHQELERQTMQLKEDLNTMTQEAAVVNAELRATVDERDKLAITLEECNSRYLSCDELLETKEQELLSLMESYRALCEEVERLQEIVKHSRNVESSHNLELITVQKDKQHLEDLCKQQGTEIEQHIATLNSYEVQLSNLTNAMSRMEQTIRQEQEEKKALLLDLSSIRELCVQIEKTKDSLARQLASQSLSHDQTCADVADVTTERDLLRQQLNSVQSKMESLESLLSHQRTKEFQSEMSDNERNAEMHHLKQQISRLEAENESHKTQVRRLRGDMSVKSEELDRLKGELTTEKYQKQHIHEQVKKLRTVVGDKT